MANPSLPQVAAAFSAIFDRIEAALLKAKAQVAAVDPAQAEVIFADAFADLARARAAADPAAIVTLGFNELLEALKTGQSPVKQPPTNLAG